MYVDLLNFYINMWFMNLIRVLSLLYLEVRTLKKLDFYRCFNLLFSTGHICLKSSAKKSNYILFVAGFTFKHDTET